jgi:hypothetical protein
MQSGCSSTAALPGGKELAFPPRLKALPNGIQRAVQIE